MGDWGFNHKQHYEVRGSDWWLLTIRGKGMVLMIVMIIVSFCGFFLERGREGKGKEGK